MCCFGVFSLCLSWVCQRRPKRHKCVPAQSGTSDQQVWTHGKNASVHSKKKKRIICSLSSVGKCVLNGVKANTNSAALVSLDQDGSLLIIHVQLTLTLFPALSRRTPWISLQTKHACCDSTTMRRSGNSFATRWASLAFPCLLSPCGSCLCLYPLSF